MSKEYKIGDNVPKAGKYKCGICGDVWELEEDENFPECEACYDEETIWEAFDDSIE